MTTKPAVPTVNGTVYTFTAGNIVFAVDAAKAGRGASGLVGAAKGCWAEAVQERARAAASAAAVFRTSRKTSRKTPGRMDRIDVTGACARLTGFAYLKPAQKQIDSPEAAIQRATRPLWKVVWSQALWILSQATSRTAVAAAVTGRARFGCRYCPGLNSAAATGVTAGTAGSKPNSSTRNL